MRFRRWEWLIVFAALVCDLNSWGHQFVMDDLSRIVGNPMLTSPRRLWEIFFSPFNHPSGAPGDLYRPLTTLSFAINYWISGAEPNSFHLLNRLIHVFICLGIFWALRRLFANPKVALFTSLIFAVHPIQTEAITYINGRSDSLAMLWFVLAWLFFIRSWLSEKDHRKAYAFSLLFYLLALLSKESSVTWLGVAWLTDYVYFSKLNLKEFFADWKRKLGNIYAGYLAVTLLYLALRFSVLKSVAAIYTSLLDNPLAHAPYGVRFLTALKVMGQSIALWFWPLSLCADYSYNQISLIESWSSPTGLAVLGVSLLFLLALIGCLKRSTNAFFGLAFFLITYFVVSNLVVPIGAIRADRLMYLPSLGLSLLTGWVMARGQERMARRKGQNIFVGFFSVLLVLLAARTIARNFDWRDELSLYEQTARVAPWSAKVQNNLGVQYFRREQFPLAWQHYRLAEQIKPDYPDLLNNMGTLLLREGKTEEAVAYHRRAVELAPQSPALRNNFGLALRARGQFLEAIEQYDRVIEQYPANADAHFNKANALFHLHCVEEAIQEYNRTLQIDPAYTDARTNLQAITENPEAPKATPRSPSSP